MSHKDYFLSANHFGKRYATFMKFIQAIKDKKKAIIVAKDYVVLDKESYDDLVMRANGYKSSTVQTYTEKHREDSSLLHKENFVRDFIILKPAWSNEDKSLYKGPDRRNK